MDPLIKDLQIGLIRYFQAEKSASALVLGIGGVAIVASFFLWRSGGVWKPMIWPLLGVAVIQLVVGASVYWRTDRQIADLTAKLQRSPQVFAAEEISRMTAVMRSFPIYRGIQIVLLVVGAALALFFRDHWNAGWPAVGAGLMIQAGVMLLFDFYAERRGELYLEAVRRLLV